MRADRMLSIILYLLNKRSVTGQELADHFEVSLRTIYRDIEKICEAGVPVASCGGTGGGYYIMDGYDIEKLFLKKDEVRTLIPLVDSLGSLLGGDQSLRGLLHKLEKVSEDKTRKGNLAIDLSHFSMHEELKQFLSLTSQAIEHDKLLIFNYINRNKDFSERVVEPVRIALNDGNWHLIGFCRLRNDFRVFKLVRMRRLRLGDSFIRRDISPEEIDKIIMTSYSRRSIRVKLLFKEETGEQLPEYFAKALIVRQTDGTYCVENDYPYEEGLIKFILGFGNDCQVLAPDYFREEVRAYLKKMLSSYNH